MIEEQEDRSAVTQMSDERDPMMLQWDDLVRVQEEAVGLRLPPFEDRFDAFIGAHTV